MKEHGELRFPHHQTAIDVVTDKLRRREDILAVIVGGSVAHGFANASSDIDLMLVLSEENYQKALEKGHLLYKESESTDYPGGYVDGKYTSLSYIQTVAESGSEPARFAFQDAFVTYSSIEGMDALLHEAARYPREKQIEKMEKFYAQFQGWKWMFHEGIKRDSRYVIDFSVIHLALFGGRLILALNETLYPYHKWFMTVLAGVENKPQHLMDIIDVALQHKSLDAVETLYETINTYYDWPEYEKGWHARFMLDSELNWMTGYVPVPDL